MTTHEVAQQLLAGPDQQLWIVQPRNERGKDIYVFSRFTLEHEHLWHPRFLARERQDEKATFLIDENHATRIKAAIDGEDTRVARERSPDPEPSKSDERLLKDYNDLEAKLRTLKERCIAAGLITPEYANEQDDDSDEE